MNPQRYKQQQLSNPNTADNATATTAVAPPQEAQPQDTFKRKPRNMPPPTPDGVTGRPRMTKQERFDSLFATNIKLLESYIDGYDGCDVPVRRGDYAVKIGINDDGSHLLKAIDFTKYGILIQWCNQIRVEMNIYNNSSPESSKLNQIQMKQLQLLKFDTLDKTRLVMKDGSAIKPLKSKGRTQQQKDARRQATLQKKLAKTKVEVDQEKREQFFKMYNQAIPLLEEFKQDYGDCGKCMPLDRWNHLFLLQLNSLLAYIQHSQMFLIVMVITKLATRSSI